MEQLQTWIEEAQQAKALRRRLAEQGRSTSEVDAVLSGLYLDIGRAVVEGAEAGDSFASSASAPTLLDEGSTEGWYTEDREIPGGRLFDPGDLGEPPVTEIPTPEGLHLPPESEDADGAAAPYAVETLVSMGQRAEDPTSFLGIFRVGVATWKPDLERLLEMLRAPADPGDSKEMAVEANRIRWATAELRTLLSPFPDEVKVALLGLLGARAQQLRSRDEASDVGVRVAIDRLQRFRVERGLPIVPALLPTPIPERGSWFADSEAWWAVFRRPARSA